MIFNRNTVKTALPAIAAFVAISASAPTANAQFMSIRFVPPVLPSGPYGVKPPAPKTTKTHEKTGKYTRNMGNRWFGGGVYAMGKLKYVETTNHQNDTAHSELILRGHVNFLKRRPQVAKIHAKAVGKGRPGAVKNDVSLKIYLTDKTIVDRKASNSLSLYNLKKTLKIFPKDIQVKYPIGPVSITIKGNVGVGFKAGFTIAVNSRSIGTRVDGDAKAWAFGKADASAGMRFAKVGLTGEAKFAHQHANINGGSNTAKKLSGSMTYIQQSVILSVKAYLKLGWSKWSKKIVDWSSGKFTKTLFKL